MWEVTIGCFVSRSQAITVAQRLVELIRIPSFFEEEHAILSYVAGRVQDRGFDVEEVPFDADLLATLPPAQPPFSRVAGRHNLVVRRPGNEGGRSLILNCHLDVVPAGPADDWTYPP